MFEPREIFCMIFRQGSLINPKIYFPEPGKIPMVGIIKDSIGLNLNITVIF
jgi:hypothetical protein